MKFGIFVFGDNHPELGRSNQKYYDEILTMAEWAEDLGFEHRGDLVLNGRNMSLYERSVR